MPGGGQPTQTTTQTLNPQSQQLLDMAMPDLQKFAAGGITLPTQPMTAGFDPSQTAGQNMALGAAPAQGNIVGSAGSGSQFLTSGAALNPSSNPALAGYIKAATDPIEQNLTENTLPQLRQEATGAGQFGGSRGEIAEGLASRGAAQAEGATAANIANSGYNAGLGAMTSGLATAPGVAGAQTLPATTTSGVGDVRQSMDQAQINEQIMRQMFPQLEPLMVGQDLAGIASGIPGGTTTSTGNTPPTNWPGLLAGGGALGSALLGKGGIAPVASSVGSGLSGIGSWLSSLLPAAAVAL